MKLRQIQTAPVNMWYKVLRSEAKRFSQHFGNSIGQTGGSRLGVRHYQIGQNGPYQAVRNSPRDQLDAFLSRCLKRSDRLVRSTSAKVTKRSTWPNLTTPPRRPHEAQGTVYARPAATPSPGDRPRPPGGHTKPRGPSTPPRRPHGAQGAVHAPTAATRGPGDRGTL